MIKISLDKNFNNLEIKTQMKNKIQKFKKENNNLSLNKFHSQLELILEGQEMR